MCRALFFGLALLTAAPFSVAQPHVSLRAAAPGGARSSQGLPCSGRAVGHTTLTVRGRDVRVVSTGGFRTNAGARHVESVCPGAVLEIEVDEAGAARRLTYRARRDGGLERLYTTDLRWEPWTREAEALEARLLPDVVRELERLAK